MSIIVYFFLTSQDGFISLFGGSSKELGDRLYCSLFKDQCSSSREIDISEFFLALKKLRSVVFKDIKEASKFFFSLFVISSDLKSGIKYNTANYLIIAFLQVQ